MVEIQVTILKRARRPVGDLRVADKTGRLI